MARDHRKKKQINLFVRFIVVIFFLILIGSFIFYAIDNPGFLGSILDWISSNEVENTLPEEPGGAIEEKGTEVIEESTSSRIPSLWQGIISFFENKFNPPDEVKDYPLRITINIYFAKTGEERILVSEERSIVAGNQGNALKVAMEELLKGPFQSYHFPVIPAGTRLLGSRFADGVAEIDLSQEFLNNALDTRILDEYIIYSIVNTATEIPGIGGVIFFIEGKRIKTYGNIDLSIPLIRNTELLEKEG